MSAFTRKISPSNRALPPSTSERSTVRYSLMCRAGRSNGSPQRSSTVGLCDSPMPRSSRPPVAALAVSACCASITGWRGNVGTTAVPMRMRSVRWPASANSVSASTPAT